MSEGDDGKGTGPETKPAGTWRNWLARRLCGIAAGLVGVCLIPAWWCGRGANAWFDGDAGTQQGLARGVVAWAEADLGRENFRTGSTQFNGEWLFGTYMMAGMGLGQTALEHPEWREQHLEAMAACIERMQADEVRIFDTESWHEDPLKALETNGQAHAAYLGYMNLVLSLHRLLDPESPYAALNDRVTDYLAMRVELSPILLIETYPEQTFPVDNCAVMGSIGLYDRATGADHGELLARWKRELREAYIDASTGLLIQRVDPRSGAPYDAPRGSGTFFGAYFLSFTDTELARELYSAGRRELSGKVLGFGMMREYRQGDNGWGDIDSGPIVGGYGVSSTGFSLAGARIFGDRSWYRSVYRTAYFAGSPVWLGDRTTFVTGGPLGDAIMLAMLTAQPAEEAP